MLVSPASKWADVDEPLDIQQLAELPCVLLNPGFGVGAMVREAETTPGPIARADESQAFVLEKTA